MTDAIPTAEASTTRPDEGAAAAVPTRPSTVANPRRTRR